MLQEEVGVPARRIAHHNVQNNMAPILHDQITRKHMLRGEGDFLAMMTKPVTSTYVRILSLVTR